MNHDRRTLCANRIRSRVSMLDHPGHELSTLLDAILRLDQPANKPSAMGFSLPAERAEPCS
jgi:hypothetical protein